MVRCSGAMDVQHDLGNQAAVWESIARSCSVTAGWNSSKPGKYSRNRREPTAGLRHHGQPTLLVAVIGAPDSATGQVQVDL